MNTQNIVVIKASIANRPTKSSNLNSFTKCYYCLLPLNLLKDFTVKDSIKINKTLSGFKISKATIDDNKTRKITNKGRINISNHFDNEIEGDYEMNILDTDNIELIKL